MNRRTAGPGEAPRYTLCANCGEWIPPGEERMSDGYGLAWLCDGCKQEESRAEG